MRLLELEQLLSQLRTDVGARDLANCIILLHLPALYLSKLRGADALRVTAKKLGVSSVKLGMLEAGCTDSWKREELVTAIAYYSGKESSQGSADIQVTV
jgi:hypothetical protein